MKAFGTASGITVGATLLALLAAPSVPGAQAQARECRQALVLGLDVSGSVDMAEYRLQIDGVATALEDPEVREILLASPDAPVSIAVFEWSASSYQKIILPWTELSGEVAVFSATTNLRNWRRSHAPYATGLGTAMEFGAALLAQKPECARLTLDISGDGKNNTWPRPVMVHNSGVLGGITVNALVIGEPPVIVEGQETPRPPSTTIEELADYFRERIIRGPGSFVEVAVGFSQYSEAMKRKLLREIATFAIGDNASD